MGHGAKAGCTKCARIFTVEKRQGDGVGGRTVYGGNGWKVSSWPRRNVVEHRDQAEAYTSKRNPSQAVQQAAETGVKWSVLLKLPYVDPVRCVECQCVPLFYLILI